MKFPSFKIFKRNRASRSVVQQSKTRLRSSLPQLVGILMAEIETLRRLVDGVSGPSTKYPESGLAAVLLAVGNYYQYLRLNPSKVGSDQMILLEYISPASSRDTGFCATCKRIFDELVNLEPSAPMVRVKHNELLNTYVYLLNRLD